MQSGAAVRRRQQADGGKEFSNTLRIMKVLATYQYSEEKEGKMGRKGEQTKEHIRSAAFKLFAEKGYTRVTMQDICAECGLSKGGLYRHYEDKEQLFTDILKSLQQEEGDKADFFREQGLPATVILEEFLNHTRKELGGVTPDIGLSLYEFCIENRSGCGPTFLAEQYKRGEKLWMSLIQYGVENGEFHVNSPQETVPAILYLLEGIRMANEVMDISEEVLTGIFNQIRKMMGAV